MKFGWPQELEFMRNARATQRRCTLRCDGKLCIITGATSGVGEAAAWKFASGGAHLVLVCRNMEKAGRLKQALMDAYHVQVDVVQADFTDLESVRSAAAAILDAYERIDILIHNIGTFRKKISFTAAHFETVFCVNHLSPFLLNSLLLERVMASAPARILYVNSEGHRFSTVHPDDLEWKHHRYSGLKSYGASKSAQLLTITKFAELASSSGVTVNAMHPGAVRSNIGNENSAWYRWYASHVLNLFLKEPEISAEALYYLALSPELSHTTGQFFNQTIAETPAPHALDRAAGEHVWRTSRLLARMSAEGAYGVS